MESECKKCPFKGNCKGTKDREYPCGTRQEIYG